MLALSQTTGYAILALGRLARISHHICGQVRLMLADVAQQVTARASLASCCPPVTSEPSDLPGGRRVSVRRRKRPPRPGEMRSTA